MINGKRQQERDRAWTEKWGKKEMREKKKNNRPRKTWCNQQGSRGIRMEQGSLSHGINDVIQFSFAFWALAMYKALSSMLGRNKNGYFFYLCPHTMFFPKLNWNNSYPVTLGQLQTSWFHNQNTLKKVLKNSLVNDLK